jgi:hypothetical protein
MDAARNRREAFEMAIRRRLVYAPFLGKQMRFSSEIRRNLEKSKGFIGPCSDYI